MPKPIRCPICEGVVADTLTTFPFCSARCRTIDLGNWLDEKYTVGGDLEQAVSGEITTRVKD